MKPVEDATRTINELLKMVGEEPIPLPTVTVSLSGSLVAMSSSVNGHGFDLPGFRAGHKPCWEPHFL